MHVPQPYGLHQHHHLISQGQTPYYPYQLSSQHTNPGADSTSFDSESDTFNREFSTEAVNQTMCSPAPFTPIDEIAMYTGYPVHEDIEIFRMSSPFAGDKEMVDPRLHNGDVFADHWSRESTVNPQDIFSQPEDT